MHRKRSLGVGFGVALVGLTAWLLTVAIGPAAGKVAASNSPKAAKATVITVTAGKPSELAFKVSKTSKVPAGTITFNVTNMGIAFHNFRICSKPVASVDAVSNSCAGKTTKLLKHGETAKLTVKISKTGLYEFLCSVSGHAQAGMKGIIGVGVAVRAADEKAASKAGTPSSSNTGGTKTTPTTTTTPATTPTTTTTTTTTTASTGGTAGNGCPAGFTIQSAAAASGGDHDDDDTGAPDDGDGCI